MRRRPGPAADRADGRPRPASQRPAITVSVRHSLVFRLDGIRQRCGSAARFRDCRPKALFAFWLGPGWASDCRVQPGQTDEVDPFIAREARGYKAEGFSRQRVFISMTRNEESSLPGITSMPSTLSSCKEKINQNLNLLSSGHVSAVAPANHKICALLITRNVGPHFCFEYESLLSAYTMPFFRVYTMPFLGPLFRVLF